MRILHIGNIANNAFNAAYLERLSGLESFVISPFLYDEIATPFWEIYEETVSKQKTLEFLYKDYRYQNPEWYIHGTWKSIANELGESLRIFEPKSSSFPSQRLLQSKQKFSILRNHRGSIKKLLHPELRNWISQHILFRIRLRIPNTLRDTIRNFDVVIYHGPYVAFAKSIQENLPYLALEHGTLKNFCSGELPHSRATVEGYKMAHCIFVTNQEGLVAARELDIDPKRLIKTPHPSSDSDLAELRSKFLKNKSHGPKEKLKVFVPSRHAVRTGVDPGKGKEEILQIIYEAKKKSLRCIFLFTEIGDDINQTKRQIRDLEIEDMVLWVGLVTRKRLKTIMSQCDLIIDQLTQPSYGGITADALGIGVPCVTKHNCALDISFFGSCAPVIPYESVLQTVQLIDSMIQQKMSTFESSIRMTSWYDSNLHSSLALTHRIKKYIQIDSISNNQTRRDSGLNL